MKKLLKELKDNNIHISLYEGNVKLRFDGANPSPELVAKIKASKNEIIEYLEGEKNVSRRRSSIPKVAESSYGYPLSSSQKRLWILSQFEDGLRAYNICHQVVLNGTYDIDVFKKSVYAVVERHEILRTVFRKDELGEVYQHVMKPEQIGFKIGYKDLRNEVEQNKIVTDFLEEDSYKAFDLENGPLMSAMLFRLTDDQYMFHYNMHHIIGDGWSMGVLAKDTLAFYESYSKPGASTVPPLNVQYKDFAAWQSQRLAQNELERDKTYWLEELSGDLPLLNLPSNLQRPSLKTNSGRILEMFLPQDKLTKLNAFTQENKGTLFTTLLSFWNILMYRYTGKRDIIIGSPVAGREHLDLENQIGFYVNTVALRNRVDPELSVSEYCKTFKDKTIKDLSHQVYPFDLLVNELNLNRDTGRSAIFDVMLALQNTGEKNSESNIQSESGIVYDRGESMTKFDLEVNFAEIGSSLLFKVNFNTDVYEQSMVEQLMQHFDQLLTASICSPDTPVKDVSFLTKEEQKEQIEALDFSQVRYPETSTIVDVFEERARVNPDNIALKYGDVSLTYKELEERSNQLAHYLLTQCKINPDDLIGLILDRDEWMIVAIIGVLKAGGAYVPIDQDYPQDRIDYMLTDSNCKLVIDKQAINDFIEQQNQFSTIAPVREIKANNLAYVIYTSGTTGKPKGSLLEHKNVIRLLFNQEDRFDFNDQDAWCLFHSYCFDFSVWEIFGALLFGGKLVVVPKETTRDTNLFAELLVNEKVTVLNQTPTAFKMLQEEALKISSDLSLRYLVFGGEALNPSILKEWKKELPSCKIINMYGITETTVHVTYKEINTIDLNTSISNIGVPIPTLGTIILDENQQLVPKGVTGELCVFGAGLARSYLNKPEITQQRFINFKHDLLEETRIYRSGDLVKMLPNGELSYLGRMDDQVKIRGHRIELGEIETAILSLQEINQCVVLPKDKNGTQILIAYLIAEPDESIDRTTVKEYLQKQIPDYMVPSFYVFMDEIPMTTNGKVNKKLLPDVSDNDIIKSEYVQPQSEMESVIIDIVKNEIGESVSCIGVTDNFFDLGLDSFSLIKILNQINTRLPIELKAVDLFKYPNVRSLIQNVLNIEVEEEPELVNISEDMDSMLDIF